MLGILHAHGQEIYHLHKHPHITRITDTTMSLLAPPNIHGRRTLPITPQSIFSTSFLWITRQSTRSYRISLPARCQLYQSLTTTIILSFADQTDNKYQARRTNISGQHNNYSNMIQNHHLQDQQCFRSPINADHIHNTYTPPIHTPNT